MPTYTVVLRINVPSVGEKNVPFTGIVATSLAQAVELAKANIIVEPLSVQKTS